MEEGYTRVKSGESHIHYDWLFRILMSANNAASKHLHFWNISQLVWSL